MGIAEAQSNKSLCKLLKEKDKTIDNLLTYVKDLTAELIILRELKKDLGKGDDIPEIITAIFIDSVIKRVELRVSFEKLEELNLDLSKKEEYKRLLDILNLRLLGNMMISYSTTDCLDIIISYTEPGEVIKRMLLTIRGLPIQERMYLECIEF